MHASAGRQIRDRYDRHVRRARISVSPGASQHRLVFAVEEALRLASLPGENEGRSYYFRQIRITDLPPNGDRGVWLDKFQRTLLGSAAQAVYGKDPRALSAQAVFFRSESEALEILLHRVLARRPVDDWFWPMVAAGSAAQPGSAAPAIVDIVERLRSQAASWAAVAVALFAMPEFDVVRLLDAIPPGAAQAWLKEMDGPRPAAVRVAPGFPRPTQPAIQQAMRRMGFQDVRIVWLAALAVLLDSPSELAAGTTVWSALSALRLLTSEGSVGEAQRRLASEGEVHDVQPQRRPVSEGEANAVEPHRRPGSEGTSSGERPLESEATASARIPPPLIPQTGDEAASSTSSPASGESIPTPTPPGRLDPAIATPSADSSHSETPGSTATSPHSDQPIAPEHKASPAPLPWYCTGLPTGAGGLFFVLNVLQRVGISQALAAGLAATTPDLVPRILQHLAVRAGVAHDDPTRLWLDSLITHFPGETSFPVDTAWWPSNLRLSRSTATVDDLVRAWTLAARRWCWRNGKLTVREIVTRAGVFSVNRTDLDVSLPLDAADIRVRRTGLDLDPGWLPWFGRVVRFHYLYRGEFHHG